MQRLVVLMSLVALATACTKETKDTSPTETAAPDQADPAAADQAAAVVREPAAADPAPSGLGQAPDFTLKDLDGNEVSLSQHRGKTVVLEWFNPGCPFVVYAYTKGPLRDMPARAASEDIVWLAINSGAPGKQGHGVEVNKKAMAEWGMAHPLLVDESGEVGKAYDAKTTPHMYIIDKNGQLVYRGALDNAPLGEVRGDAPVNYVNNALAALAQGKAIDPAETTPYGCTVKYAD